MKYFSAATVSVIVLGEPIVASLLALLILGEKLSIVKILGGVVILGGVTLVLMAETKEYRKKPCKSHPM